MGVMEDTIDSAATALISRFDYLLDLIDRAEKAQMWEPAEYACTNTGLDFLTYTDKGRRVAITEKTGMTPNGKAKFKKQLQRCAVCLNARECYETAIATGSEFGIWGGTFPHERRSS